MKVLVIYYFTTNSNIYAQKNDKLNFSACHFYFINYNEWFYVKSHFKQYNKSYTQSAVIADCHKKMQRKICVYAFFNIFFLCIGFTVRNIYRKTIS